MYKFIINIILFFSFIFVNLENSFSQSFSNKTLKNDREFFSTSYYHIFRKNISNGELDKYVSLINASGDKSLVKDLVLRHWIFKENNSYPSLKTFENVSLPYPPLFYEKFSLDDLNKLNLFLIYNEINSYQDFNFFTNIEEVMKVRDSFSPNLFNIENYDLQKDCFNYIKQLSQNAGEYPDEVERLIKYYNDIVSELSVINPNKSNLEFYALTKTTCLTKYPFLKIYLYDISIGECLNQSFDLNDIAVPSLVKIQNNLENFINDTYLFIFSREANLSEISIWSDYYHKNDAIPGMILYILLNSEEYKYF